MVSTVRYIKNQRGAATLLTAMALMMVTTSMVLAAVHAQLLNNRANGNMREAAKDYLLAEAGLEYAIEYLNSQFYKIYWVKNGSKETHTVKMPPIWTNHLDLQNRNIQLNLSRLIHQPEFIEISSQVSHTVHIQQILNIQQTVRPLSLLSPKGEQAPPLVMKDCIHMTSGTPDIYPGKQTTLNSVPAIWSSQKQNCHQLKNMDLHHGSIDSQILKSGNLWDFLFFVSPKEYRDLVANELNQTINKQQRHYWLAGKDDLHNDRWTQSLGTAQQPVVLVFPANLGCPAITSGTAIYGIVYYEADCANAHQPLQGEIFGTLAINGGLAVYSDQLKLSHISQATHPETALKFPILKISRLLGTWIDF